MEVTERPRFRKSSWGFSLSRVSNRAGNFLDSDIGRLKIISPLVALRKVEPWKWKSTSLKPNLLGKWLSHRHELVELLC